MSFKLYWMYLQRFLATWLWPIMRTYSNCLYGNPLFETLLYIYIEFLLLATESPSLFTAWHSTNITRLFPGTGPSTEGPCGADRWSDLPQSHLRPTDGRPKPFLPSKKNGGVTIMPGKYGIMDFLKVRTLHTSKPGLCQLLIVFFFGLDVLSNPSTGWNCGVKSSEGAGGRSWWSWMFVQKVTVWWFHDASCV